MKKIIIVIIIILIVGAGVYFWERQGRSAQPTQEIAVELIADGFVSPVAFVSSPDGTGRMFVVDQIGLIRVMDSTGEVLESNFLDLRDKLVQLNSNYDERGLLGLAFHPNFKENGRFFVYYSAPLRENALAGWDHTSALSEFKVDGNNPNIADVASERIILQVDEPQFNHNAGHIAFGPDGYLYVPLGDGGEANDVGLGHPSGGNGQDVSTLLGSILRLDIDKGNPYAVPADNPFVDGAGQDEIFAYGFRNPYHISFDAVTGQLFVADVGQNLWEEVDIVTRGNNYGWNIREGKHCFDPASPNQSPATCPATGARGEVLLDPIIEYGHPNNGGTGVAIVGGYVYRGETIKGLKGNYVFGDWSRGFTKGDGSIFAAALSEGNWSFRELGVANLDNKRLSLFLKGIGQDSDGELYLLATEAVGPSGNTGKIFKIVPVQNVTR